MAQTDTPGKSAPPANPVTQAYDQNSTLKVPFWFLVIAVLLFSVRIYAKETQMKAAPGQGVAWLTPVEFKQKKDSGQLGNQDLILYEFTADWCPPCKKRERTTFRNPQVVKLINTNYIPVRIDVTTEARAAEPETKLLTDKFNVDRIPHCEITLKSGESVANDTYLYGETFDEFLASSIKSANIVRAQLMLSRGKYKEALACLNPDVINGKKELYYYGTGDYIMCHHLLKMLHRDADIEPLIKNTFDTTLKARSGRGFMKQNTMHWLENLNSYLRGQETDEQAIANVERGEDEAGLYLAIGLKCLRDGDTEKAKKNLNKSALLGAKSYHSDKVAEYLLKELDK